MYKLFIITAMMTLWISVHLLQVEEEMAMKTLFLGKHALNRAAHAAAQQLDVLALADGVMRIDPEAAELAAAHYLQANLLLDAAGKPLPNSFLRHPVEVLVFDIVNVEQTFPFYYRNDVYHYEVVLRRPGVVLIAKVVYPRAFQVIDSIEWNIKGAAELVLNH